jgi:translation initiation factor eIF-2B subunit delta
MSLLEKIKNVIGSVRNDHLSGSAALQRKLERGLLDLLEGASDFSVAELQELMSLLEQLKDDLKQFAVLGHFLRHLINRMPSAAEGSARYLRQVIMDYREAWRDVNDRVCKNFLENVGEGLFRDKVVLVHSNSSVVRDLFRCLKDRDIRMDSIFQTESRPVMEGRDQASFLVSLGYEVSLVPDLMAEMVILATDMVILGADMITPDGIINKMGSYTLSLLANAEGVPVYVLADSRKIIDIKEWDPDNPELFAAEQPKPSEEVWGDPPAGVEVWNYYFGEVPAFLLTALVTENDLVPGKMLTEAPFFRT